MRESKKIFIEIFFLFFFNTIIFVENGLCSTTSFKLSFDCNFFLAFDFFINIIFPDVKNFNIKVIANRIENVNRLN